MFDHRSPGSPGTNARLCTALMLALSLPIHATGAEMTDAEVVQIAALSDEMRGVGRYLDRATPMCVSIAHGRLEIPEVQKARLTALWSDVRWAPDCTTPCRETRPDTGQFSCAFVHVGTVWFYGKDYATVEVGSGTNLLAGRTDSCLLQRSGDQWKIIGRSPRSVS